MYETVSLQFYYCVIETMQRHFTQPPRKQVRERRGRPTPGSIRKDKLEIFAVRWATKHHKRAIMPALLHHSYCNIPSNSRKTSFNRSRCRPAPSSPLSPPRLNSAPALPLALCAWQTSMPSRRLLPDSVWVLLPWL